jgi:hypothetical protein
MPGALGETTSHSTRLPKNVNQVAGYLPPPRKQVRKRSNRYASFSKYPPAKPGALVLLAPQRGKIVKRLKALVHIPNFS